MIISISRELSAFGGIYSFATWGDRRLWAMERAWDGNRANQSCVPMGEYDVRPFDGATYKETFCLVGSTVSQWPAADKPRSACCIHPSKFPSGLKGCVAFGTGVDPFGALIGYKEATADVIASIRQAGSGVRILIGGQHG